MGYPASSGTSLVNVLHIAYRSGFSPLPFVGIITVNLGRLSSSAHSCTSDHGMSNFSSSLLLVLGFGSLISVDVSPLTDEDELGPSLSEEKLLADAVICRSVSLVCPSRLSNLCSVEDVKDGNNN